MRSIVIDTNIFTAIRQNKRDVIQYLERADVILISDFVLAELYYGYKLGNKYEENLAVLHEFLENPYVKAQHTSLETAEIFSSIRVKLKQAGTPIPLHDIWIASQAIETGSVLMTFDQHFSYVDGLRIWPS